MALSCLEFYSEVTSGRRRRREGERSEGLSSYSVLFPAFRALDETMAS